MKPVFNGVKVFSATMQPQRGELGDVITAWRKATPTYEIVDVVVTQSSDNAFHCLAITFFFNDPAFRR